MDLNDITGPMSPRASLCGQEGGYLRRSKRNTQSSWVVAGLSAPHYPIVRSTTPRVRASSLSSQRGALRNVKEHEEQQKRGGSHGNP